MPNTPFEGDDQEPDDWSGVDWDAPPEPARRPTSRMVSADGQSIRFGPLKPPSRIKGLNLEAEHFTAEGVLDFAKLVVEAREGSHRDDVLSHSSEHRGGPSVGSSVSAAPSLGSRMSVGKGPILLFTATVAIATGGTVLLSQGFTGGDPGPEQPYIFWAPMIASLLLAVVSLIAAIVFGRRAAIRLRTKHRVTKLVEESLDVAKSELEFELQKSSGGASS